MKYMFYCILELIFTILWLPFGLTHFALSSLMKWAHNKQVNIWMNVAAEEIAYCNREREKERKQRKEKK